MICHSYWDSHHFRLIRQKVVERILALGNGIITIFMVKLMYFLRSPDHLWHVSSEFLTVPLEMLVALYVLKTVFHVVVDSVMVMHSFDIRSEEGQQGIIIQTRRILMGMGDIISD